LMVAIDWQFSSRWCMISCSHSPLYHFECVNRIQLFLSQYLSTDRHFFEDTCVIYNMAHKSRQRLIVGFLFLYSQFRHHLSSA
jgi:hypothetical protein